MRVEGASDPGAGSGGEGPETGVRIGTALVLDLLSRDGAVWVREASPSMSPLIRPGDEVRLVPVDPSQVHRGTLIAYRRDGRLVLHRVLAQNGDGVIAKGDGLVSSDPPVGWDQVVGRVAALRRVGAAQADLDAFPWPAVNHALGVIAAVASRLPLGNGAGENPPRLARLAWKSLRVPFHLARCLVP